MKQNSKSFDLKRQQRFSIRKFSYGAASVLVASLFFLGTGAVYADSISEEVAETVVQGEQNETDSEATSEQVEVLSEESVAENEENAVITESEQAKNESELPAIPTGLFDDESEEQVETFSLFSANPATAKTYATFDEVVEDYGLEKRTLAKNGDRDGTYGANGEEVNGTWQTGIRRTIYTQQDFNDYLATTGDEWNDSLEFRNDETITIPAGTYYIHNSTTWWLLPGYSGNIELGDAIFAVYNERRNSQTDFEILVTGDQKGRTVSGGNFVGTFELAENNGTIQRHHFGTSTGTVGVTALKASNITFDNMTFANSNGFNGHTFDLMGVDNVTISNSTFAGALGGYTNAQLASIPGMTDHNYYSEAIQIDYATYGESHGEGGVTAKKLLNDRKSDSYYYTNIKAKYFDASMLDGKASSNVTITGNTFTTYNGKSGRGLAVDAKRPYEVGGTKSVLSQSSVDTVNSPRSLSVGSHSIYQEDYKNITITDNTFKNTTVVPANESWMQIMFSPIHMHFANATNANKQELVESKMKELNWVVEGNNFEGINTAYFAFDSGYNTQKDSTGESASTHGNAVGWFESVNTTRFVDKDNKEIAKTINGNVDPISIEGYTYSTSYRKVADNAPAGSIEITHAYVKNETTTEIFYRETTTGVEKVEVTTINGVKQPEKVVETYTNIARKETVTNLEPAYQADATKTYPSRETTLGEPKVEVTGVTYKVVDGGKGYEKVDHSTESKEGKAAIIVVGTKPKEETADIAFETTYEANKELVKGTEKEIQAGVNGSEKLVTTYELNTTTGEVTINEQKLGEGEILAQPVAAIVEVGTKPEEKMVYPVFETEYIADNSLAFDAEPVVKQAGQAGESVVTTYYKLVVNTDNSYEVVEDRKDSKVISEPITRVLAVSTLFTGTESIDYTTEYVSNPDVEAGLQTVITKGQNGVRQVTTIYDLNSVTGERTPKDTTTEILVEPIIEEISVGTKPLVESIEFDTTYEIDETLKSGETKILVEGQNGLITTAYILDEKTGAVTEDINTTNPTTRVIAISLEDTLKEEIPYETEYLEDEEYAPGEEIVEISGKKGIKVYIVVDGKEILISQSSPVTEVIRLGAGIHQHGEGEQADPKPEADIQVDVLPFTTREIFDENLTAGQRIVEQEGKDGSRTYVATPDGEFELENIPAVEEIVRVGTKVLAPTAEPTPAPTTEPTPAPTTEPTPAPTAEPTPAPTAEPTPAPTAEPTPAPTAEPAPVLTSEPEQEKPNGSGAAAGATITEQTVSSHSASVTGTRTTNATYSRVARAQAQAEKSLPNTGDATSVLGLLGLGISSLGLVGLKKRKK